MTLPFVALEHVTVVRGGRTVLEDLSLTIAQGEQVALLGPNGCGKSTLLKVLTCELYPLARERTRVELLGRARWDTAELKRRMGVVPAELPGEAMRGITAFEAVLTGFFSSARMWPHLHATDAMRERTAQMLTRLSIAHLESRLFGELSAGQQRRVLIGRALVASAGCLLLDEPSNALDLYAQRELRTLLQELAGQGTTLLLITHHLADILPTMERVVALRAGRIVHDGGRELLTSSGLSALFETTVSVERRDGFLHAY